MLKQLKELNPLVMDIEFTGTDRHDEAIEISIINLDYDVLFYSRLKPQVKKFHFYSHKINKINYKDLISCITFPELEESISSIIRNRFIICYNPANDKKILEQTYFRYDRQIPFFITICLAELYKSLTGLVQPVKLQLAAKELNIEAPTHNALEDSIVTAKIFNKLLELYE